MKIGAQMYTLRAHCQTLEDFALSLRKVADIGYSTVQVSGTCPFDAAWLQEELQRNGLQCVLTHTPPDRLTDETTQVIAEHDVFRCGYVSLGYYSFGETQEMTGYAHFLNTYGPVARKLHEGGKYFMYHNHDREFRRIRGATVLEKLARDFPAEQMGFTLDTYWVQYAGGDPAQWLSELSGRVPCIHLKDMTFDRKMAVIGEGNINFDRVFETAWEAGTRYMPVEQDDCNGEDPFACLRRSYLYLKSCGFS